MESERFVLDSYALLAFLESESSGEEIERLFRQASAGRCRLLMSVANLGEVLYITERERGLNKVHEVLARVDELPIKVVDADREHVLTAAHIKAGCSVAYADCFTAALAKLEDATVVTGDPEFKKLEAAVSIAWLDAK